MQQLTLETIDGLIEQVLESGLRELDLRGIGFMDPYALLLLDLLVLEQRDKGIEPSITWPERNAVRGWIGAMGLHADLSLESGSPTTRDLESTLQPITRIEDESRVTHVVEGFHQRLADRYPLTESSRRSLVALMIELFQNIPHHSNADGSIEDSHGMAAMQDYADSIFLSVADRGIGLRASLGLREGYEGLTDAQALDDIFYRGISRFSDPGRGGELRRIADLVRSWDGILAVRSGSALFYAGPHGSDIYDVPRFPGVQLGLRLSRRAFS